MTEACWQHSMQNLGDVLDRLEDILGEPLGKHDYILDATIQQLYQFLSEKFSA